MKNRGDKSFSSSRRRRRSTVMKEALLCARVMKSLRRCCPLLLSCKRRLDEEKEELRYAARQEWHRKALVVILFISLSLSTTNRSALKRCEGRFHIINRKESPIFSYSFPHKV